MNATPHAERIKALALSSHNNHEIARQLGIAVHVVRYWRKRFSVAPEPVGRRHPTTPSPSPRKPHPKEKRPVNYPALEEYISLLSSLPVAGAVKAVNAAHSARWSRVQILDALKAGRSRTGSGARVGQDDRWREAIKRTIDARVMIGKEAFFRALEARGEATAILIAADLGCTPDLARVTMRNLEKEKRVRGRNRGATVIWMVADQGVTRG